MCCTVSISRHTTHLESTNKFLLECLLRLSRHMNEPVTMRLKAEILRGSLSEAWQRLSQSRLMPSCRPSNSRGRLSSTAAKRCVL
eukprot:3128931-Amphidinium_carterae.2